MSYWDLRRHPQNAPAIYDAHDQTPYSYGQLADIVEQVAEKFRARKNKSLVFAFCRNEAGGILGYLAALSARQAIYLGNGDGNPEHQRVLLNAYRPDWVWQPAQLPCPDLYQPAGLTLLGYTLFERQKPEPKKIHPDLALLLSTSGTTGSQKLVRLSPLNLQANAESIAAYLGITSAGRAITTLPMSYSYGLSVINSHLLAGASLVCSNYSVMTKDFWHILREQNCTSLAGVPYTYQMLSRLRFEKMDLPSLRTMTQAGGALAKDLQLKFHELARQRGIRFFVMYGQTEATARISYLSPEDLPAQLGSIGKAIPGGRIRLMDGREEISSPHRVGELVYEGPNVMLGYAEKMEDLALGDELRGVLHTGDLASRNEDGYFFIQGRLKRFIKLYGLRLNLDEIEGFVETTWGMPAACIGSDDRLEVVLQGTDRERVKEVQQGIAKEYGIHHSSIAVHFVEQLPYTSNGKKNYPEVQSRLGTM